MTLTLRDWGRLAAAIGSLALLACAAQGQSTPNRPPPAAAPSPPADSSQPPVATSARPRWMQVDSAARTVALALEITATPGAPSALINGYRAGDVRIVVPVGWTVRWNWRNADPASAHSLVVMGERERIPLEGGRAAFSNARTHRVTEGLAPGQTDQTTFVADEAGWYWLLCGVHAHGINGEWFELRVDPEAKTAAVELKKKA
jgi:plastocyanin